MDRLGLQAAKSLVITQLKFTSTSSGNLKAER